VTAKKRCRSASALRRWLPSDACIGVDEGQVLALFLGKRGLRLAGLGHRKSCTARTNSTSGMASMR
jgi:hypothetical protein